MMAVTFTPKGRLHYVDPGPYDPRVADHVLVETDLGPEVAQVVWAAEEVEGPLTLPRCVGPAQAADLERDAANRRRRAQIRVAAQRMVREDGLAMKVVAVDWADRGHESGRPTATVYFTAPGRVDFRQLVRDLSLTLDCKVMLTQLSARDSARVQGSVGSCGRETCCSTFLTDFEPVTVRMARDQDLPLNPMRISGACGRLMCCLKYEHPLYQAAIDSWPAVGDRVETPEGEGRVVGHQVPGEQLVVRLDATGTVSRCPVAGTCASRKAYESRA